MSANQDFVALDWIKADISETLEQAQQALESYAESSQNSSSIRTCLTALHQVHGTLKMVQIVGPTDMALEMEAVAQALMNETVPDQDEAQEVLMQSILQMPGYLDRIQRDQQDIPEFVATVVDNLRGARGAERLNLSAASSNANLDAFDFDLLSAPTPAEIIEIYKNQNGPETVKKLRSRYQQSLVALLKKTNPRENLNLMGKVLAKLEKISSGSPAGYFAQLGLALVEGIASGGVKLDGKSASLLKRIDGPLKVLAEDDEAAIAKSVSDDFANDLLEILSGASKKTARIAAVLKLFAASEDSIAPSVADFGPDDETLAAVSRILIEEFTAITDKLDIYVRSSARNQQGLFDLLPDLEQVSSTLSVVGLVEHLSRVDNQLAMIRLLQDENAEPTEEQLLEMAGSLLEIQSNLNRVVGDTNDEGESGNFGDLDEAQATVVRETRNGLAECKDNIIEFVTNNFSLDKLERLPSLLNSLAGGLLIVNQQRAGAVLEASALYVERNLMRDGQQPALSDMDDLADAITSIDYYLERFLESAKDPYLQMISVAEEAIAKLGYNVEELASLKLQQAPAVLQDTEVVTQSDSDIAIESDSEIGIESIELNATADECIETVPVEVLEDAPRSEVQQEVQQELQPEVAASTDATIDSTVEQAAEANLAPAEEEIADDLIDDEIIEIFIEEVDEVLEKISKYLTQWQTDIGDQGALTEIRRAFHTLKGSGRMVGATVVGELAWSIENLLNRIIENTLATTAEIQSLVVEVVSQIPAGIDAFKNQHQETFLVSHLVEQAETFALATIPREINLEPSAELELSAESEPSAEQTPSDLELVQADDELISSDSNDDVEDTISELLNDDIAAAEVTAFIDNDEVDAATDFELEELEEAEIQAAAEDANESAAVELDASEADALVLESLDLESVEVELEEIVLDEPDPAHASAQSSDEETPIADTSTEAADSTADPSLSFNGVTDDATDDAGDDIAQGMRDLDANLDDNEFATLEEITLADIELDDAVVEASESVVSESSGAEQTSPELIEHDVVDLIIGPIIELSDEAADHDSELDEIFLGEAIQNLAVIKAFLAGPQVVSGELISAFHTLKGSGAMADVVAISDVAGPLESLSNKYFNSAKQVDDTFVALVERAAELIDIVISNLAMFRHEVDGSEAFQAQCETLNLMWDVEDALPPFEFEGIRLLSKFSEIFAEWDMKQVGQLIEELRHVEAQARVTEREELITLTASMLRCYSEMTAKPNADVENLLINAHETLLVMFDHIASSQGISSPTEIIRELDRLDFAAIEAQQEQDTFVVETFALLGQVASLMEVWAADLNNVKPIQDMADKLIGIESEASSKQIVSIAETIGPMVQLCEQITVGALSATQDDLRLLDSARNSLLQQLEVYKQGGSTIADAAVLAAFNHRFEAKVISVAAEVSDDAISEALDEGVNQAIHQELLPADEIDEDVLGIFLEEAEELNEAIDESILQWSNNTDSSEYLDNLLRHLHTLKGSARLAGLNSLGEYTHNFESVLIGFQQNPSDMDDEFFVRLNAQQDEINRRTEIYNRLAIGDVSDADLASLRLANAPELMSASSLAASPDTLAELAGDELSIDELFIDESSTEVGAAQEPSVNELSINELPEDKIDEDILAIFIEEAHELNEAIDQSILDWGSNPQTSEYCDNLLRHLHTMKGGARLAGLNSLGEYTHNFETFLIKVQQTSVPFDQAFFATVNRRQDEITRRVGVYQRLLQGDAQPEELAAMTRDLESTAPITTSPALAESQTSTDEPQTQTSERDSSASSEPALITKPDSEKAVANQSQEMVRVSSELLEELIGLSGESNITRGRVEQQIRDFGESLQEMEDTINRIREQVRRLEIEAESRETVFRNTENTSKSNFDDLEMDRYTMLQEISRTLNEGSSDMLDLKDTLSNKSRDAESLLHQQARIGTELQEGLTRTRMVPIARLIPRLRRIVRQISGEVGKSVRFDAFNVEGELDRTVLEKIVAPLEHMLRNAVDHGIESSDKRLAANKPATGRISLRLSREGGYLVLNVSDDGGGINVDAVKNKAIERGVINADDDISDHEVMQFIMHAGFSTAEKLTQISGRGVGMDVVTSEIKQLGGSVSIDSTLGLGTEFTIRIPFTVSINRALLVVVREETYAIPLNSIEGMVRVSPYELEAYYQPDAPLYEYAGQPYRLAYMGKMLEKSNDPDLTGQVSPLPVILASNGDSAVALQVDRVIGSREVVVKSLGPQFSKVGGIAGATVMGDGSIVVILDLMALVDKADLREESVQEVEELHEIARPRARKVMIVDDSVTVRKVTTRLMERQGWEVTTAKDGVDAVSQLQDIYPDVVLLDIEMPKMDGFEVLRTVRRDDRLAKLPIIMITSRTGEKHKQQALELGVNRFLGKPFQEANLISTIDEVIAESDKE
jgi:chemosensory pili system protein ChpA (sensor histidine kinase/response regulator)